MKSEIEVKFEAPTLMDVPVELKADPKKPKQKDRRAMADAAAFVKFGVQVIRVKARVLAALGKEAEQCGIKQIGHGKILLASDNAELAISKLGQIVDKLMKEPAPDYSIVVEIMGLQREFNAQLIRSAEAHFSADKQPFIIPPSGTGGITVPYPAGAPVMIAVGKSPGTSGTNGTA